MNQFIFQNDDESYLNFQWNEPPVVYTPISYKGKLKITHLK